MGYKKSGFTLIEAVLSIALITIITAISLPVYQSFQVKNDTDLARTTLVQAIRRAQLLSRAMEGDSEWGIYIAPGGGTLYKGASYASRDFAFDESYSIPTSIAPSGLTTIHFSKLSGLPTTVGTTTLTSVNADVVTISINTKGVILY